MTPGSFSLESVYTVSSLFARVSPEKRNAFDLQMLRELAERIAAQAPLAVRAILRSARLNLEQGQDAAMGVLLEQTRALMQSEDALEGMMSFIERREARFQGK